ncbi:MAG: aminotransferase class III-fold pyridoxal phosphate-dependent enzyme, partial [Myxococcales bacterium]|nr:aminotransferase class III-fold pyridoxal phosphate-dependent enzyme [Myxococcales bacterium]
MSESTPCSPTDLEALEARHAQEEAAESGRHLLVEPRPLRTQLPPGGRLEISERWLGRLYEGDRVAREKKPGVFDHLRSSGPYFVSVDEPPLSVIDGMSQTATVPGGFAEDPVVAAYVHGAFGQTPIQASDTSLGPDAHAEAYAALLRQIVPGLPQISFTNSGAEANEKAYALCLGRRRSAAQTKLLAFEGSFHGRTLLALHATHNPAKRGPFEFEGHEASFAPFPVWLRPQDGEPGTPPGWLEAVAQGRLEGLDAGGDPLLESELHSLRHVDALLAGGEFFAIAIEPMQSEGGDRYATSRFHRALRLLSRFHDVPLIMDEVQTGFGLGGTFAWHQRFELIDAEGAPDTPDCVLFAKRAQVGVVMSRFEDPEPTSAHAASLVRGRIHADWMRQDPDSAAIEALVRAQLAGLEGHPLVADPRAQGYALAFELPSPQHLVAFLAQRFYRGTIVFGAGSRTVRFRLNRSFGPQEIDRIFASIHATLEWIEAHPDEKPPAWIDAPASPKAPPASLECRVRRASPEERELLLERIVQLEARAYEPARRDRPEWLALAFTDPDGIAIVAEVQDEDGAWRLVGSTLGVPLEVAAAIEGCDRDPFLGRANTLYSQATTVDPDLHGHGLGFALKRAQLQAAFELRDVRGEARYRHITGRNRVGRTDAMMRLTRKLGAYEVFRLESYGEPGAEALYYRLPVGPFIAELPASDSALAAEPTQAPLDLADISRPLRAVPASLMDAFERGDLYGPTVNKITVSNYATPATIRATEYLAAIAERHPRLYFTSSRDETVDKALRVLRLGRPDAQLVLGLEGGYHGHTSAAARSLSDPAVHRQGPGHFRNFRRVPHPAEAGVELTLEAIDASIEEAGGPDRVLGIFIEPVQERTGRLIPDPFWPALEDLREQLGIPVVFSETATAAYRS